MFDIIFETGIREVEPIDGWRCFEPTGDITITIRLNAETDNGS